MAILFLYDCRCSRRYIGCLFVLFSLYLVLLVYWRFLGGLLLLLCFLLHHTYMSIFLHLDLSFLHSFQGHCLHSLLWCRFRSSLTDSHTGRICMIFHTFCFALCLWPVFFSFFLLHHTLVFLSFLLVVWFLWFFLLCRSLSLSLLWFFLFFLVVWFFLLLRLCLGICFFF